MLCYVSEKIMFRALLLISLNFIINVWADDKYFFIDANNLDDFEFSGDKAIVIPQKFDESSKQIEEVSTILPQPVTKHPQYLQTTSQPNDEEQDIEESGSGSGEESNSRHLFMDDEDFYVTDNSDGSGSGSGEKELYLSNLDETRKELMSNQHGLENRKEDHNNDYSYYSDFDSEM